MAEAVAGAGKILLWDMYIEGRYGNRPPEGLYSVTGQEIVIESLSMDSIYDDYDAASELRDLKTRLIRDYGQTHEGLQWLKANVFDSDLDDWISEREAEEEEERRYEAERQEREEQRRREREAEARAQREREARRDEIEADLRRAESRARSAAGDPEKAAAALTTLLAAQERAREEGIL